jgi:hypothetical protein
MIGASAPCCVLVALCLASMLLLLLLLLLLQLRVSTSVLVPQLLVLDELAAAVAVVAVLLAVYGVSSVCCDTEDNGNAAAKAPSSCEQHTYTVDNTYKS